MTDKDGKFKRVHMGIDAFRADPEAAMELALICEVEVEISEGQCFYLIRKLPPLVDEDI